LSFGLVSIPFKIYTAASADGVKFHQLHEKCGNRIKYQVYCPTDDEVVERSDLVKGYEYAKGQFVRFDADELKALEEEKTHNLEIIEFVPLDTVDFVFVEKSYYLGPDKGGHKAYRLLGEAMQETGRVALGHHVARGKSHLVVIRPYREGLMMHQVFYSNEVRDFGDIDLSSSSSARTASSRTSFETSSERASCRPPRRRSRGTRSRPQRRLLGPKSSTSSRPSRQA
jgi:DNA end-binding protein Ku